MKKLFWFLGGSQYTVAHTAVYNVGIWASDQEEPFSLLIEEQLRSNPHNTVANIRRLFRLVRSTKLGEQSGIVASFQTETIHDLEIRPTPGSKRFQL